MRSNPAVTEPAELMRSTQASVPSHSPDQPCERRSAIGRGTQDDVGARNEAGGASVATIDTQGRRGDSAIASPVLGHRHSLFHGFKMGRDHPVGIEGESAERGRRCRRQTSRQNAESPSAVAVSTTPRPVSKLTVQVCPQSILMGYEGRSSPARHADRQRVFPGHEAGRHCVGGVHGQGARGLSPGMVPTIPRNPRSSPARRRA